MSDPRFREQLLPGDVLIDSWVASWPCDPQEVPTRIIRDKDGSYSLDFYLGGEWIVDGDCHQSILRRCAFLKDLLQEALRRVG